MVWDLKLGLSDSRLHVAAAIPVFLKLSVIQSVLFYFVLFCFVFCHRSIHGPTMNDQYEAPVLWNSSTSSTTSKLLQTLFNEKSPLTTGLDVMIMSIARKVFKTCNLCTYYILVTNILQNSPVCRPYSVLHISRKYC